MSRVSIPEAIWLFEYSSTGRQEQRSRNVTQRLRELYHGDHDLGDGDDDTEIGYVDMGTSGTFASYRRDRSGYDLRINRRVLSTFARRQRLAAVSLLIVHEAVHALRIHADYINDEVECRRLETLYFIELTTIGVFNEMAEGSRRRPRPEWVRLDPNHSALRTFSRQAPLHRRNQLVDHVVGIREYRRSLSPRWIRDNRANWGGFGNRQARTLGYYVREVIDSGRGGYVGLMLDILESVGSEADWARVVRMAGGARALQGALDPSHTYRRRISQLQSRWNTRLIE